MALRVPRTKDQREFEKFYSEIVTILNLFSPPQMTTAQRDAIAVPLKSMMIYNTTTNKLNFYNGTAWAAVTSA